MFTRCTIRSNYKIWSPLHCTEKESHPVTLNCIWKLLRKYQQIWKCMHHCLHCYNEEIWTQTCVKEWSPRFFHRSYTTFSSRPSDWKLLVTYDVSRCARDIMWSWTEWQRMTVPPQISGISRSLAPTAAVIMSPFLTVIVRYTRWRQSISCKAEQRWLLQGWQTDKKVWDWNLSHSESVQLSNY